MKILTIYIPSNFLALVAFARDWYGTLLSQNWARDAQNASLHTPVGGDLKRFLRLWCCFFRGMCANQVTEAGGMTKFIESGAAKLRIEEAATKKQVSKLAPLYLLPEEVNGHPVARRVRRGAFDSPIHFLSHKVEIFS